MFFTVQISYSQTHIYKHFGVDDGLPTSEVYDTYQDKQGYVWFATDKGLSRFNGYEFKNFTIQDGLPDNTILDFYPQENGQVWCYGYQSQKLFYFNEVFDGFKTYAFNDVLKTQLITKSIIKSVVFDGNEDLYVGGHYLNGLIKITNKGDLETQFDLNTNILKPKEKHNVGLGIETNKGVFFNVYDSNYKSKENIFIFFPNNTPTSRVDIIFLNDKQTVFIDTKLGVLSKNDDIKYFETEQYPIGVKRINDSLFFVGYYNNGAEIRGASGQIIKKFLPKKSVTDFLIDAEGSYWFTTLDEGVFYLKNPSIEVYMEEHMSSLVKDNNNKLYAGLNNGNIVSISKMKIDTLYEGLKNSKATVEFDRKHNHLYGYSDGLFINYTKREKMPEMDFITNIPEDIGDNQLLVPNNNSFSVKENNQIKKYDLKYNVHDVCRYKETIFIGTSSGLLVQKDGVIKTHYESLDILKYRIDDLDVNTKTNSIYIATQGAGIVVYKDDNYYSINKENGLTNNIVSEVHIENDSVVWACTNSGLNRISFKTNNIFDVTTITKEDGLLSNDINDVEIINDTIWVATKKGLCFFKKEFLLEKRKSKIISLTLKDISVNNTSIKSEHKKLKHNQNNIDFTLQGISQRNTNKITYLYRLKEIDTNWTTTKNRSIHFTSLLPGNYTFEAKAQILNYENNNLITYSFKILPPFWRSWWFYTICALLFIGLIYLFFKIRVLTYNKDIIRELMRLAIKRLKRKEQFYSFRSNGEDFKIPTHQIQYINSQGNYLDIVTDKKTYTFRCKINDFVKTTPDSLEYLRVHRSYIIRIDQVSSKGKNWVVIKDQKIPVGETYLYQLEKIQF